MQTKASKNLIKALCLVTAILFSMTACSKSQYQINAVDMMEGIPAKPVSMKPADELFIHNSADFAVEIFKQTITANENSLISPLSVLIALTMTANGADNQTLRQMEEVLGKSVPLDELNEYLHTYIKSLPSENKSKLNIANSIWFCDDEERLTVEQDFLQKNADYYHASVYKSAFDNQTIKDINAWVNEKTEGMINKILEQIDEDAVMYLINALVFDAEWETVYKKNEISKGDFIAIGGSKQTADFMNSTESYYLNDGRATGFIKPYANNNYSFVALLPNEDVAINDYIATLSGGKLLDVINNAEQTPVFAALPKFNYEYTVQMKEALVVLGMQDAFNIDADFRPLGSSTRGDIFIHEVLHKTYINVDELGTKAGAVTKVEMHNGAAFKEKHVRLDRPFVFSIIDSRTNLPIFIGTVMNIK